MTIDLYSPGNTITLNLEGIAPQAQKQLASSDMQRFFKTKEVQDVIEALRDGYALHTPAFGYGSRYLSRRQGKRITKIEVSRGVASKLVGFKVVACTERTDEYSTYRLNE